jgi:hypothetical protein
MRRPFSARPLHLAPQFFFQHPQDVPPEELAALFMQNVGLPHRCSTKDAGRRRADLVVARHLFRVNDIPDCSTS